MNWRFFLLNDEELLASFKKAIEIGADKEFIAMLWEEIQNRGLENNVSNT